MMESNLSIETSRPVILDGVAYSKGRHSVPSSAAKSWFFDALVQDGIITVIEATTAKDPGGKEPGGVDEKPRKQRSRNANSDSDDAKPAAD